MPGAAGATHFGVDELVRAVSAGGEVSVRAVVATAAVREATGRYPMSPTAKSALGRALLGAVLLAVGNKQEQSVQLLFRGNGPLGSLTAIADSEGRVRGSVGDPDASPAPRDGQLDVGTAVGAGTLTVVRHHPSWRHPYNGIVRIETGEIATDLAHYLRESEQTASAIGLAVGLDAVGDVDSAAGFLVQALPGASAEALAQLERNVKLLPNTAELARLGMRGDAIVDRLLVELGSADRQRLEPRFFCPCTRERARRTLKLLGRAELREIAATEAQQEVRCEFCGECYVFSAEELHALAPDA
jgi:molecular chaperone Hsp33